MQKNLQAVKGRGDVAATDLQLGRLAGLWQLGKLEATQAGITPFGAPRLYLSATPGDEILHVLFPPNISNREVYSSALRIVPRSPKFISLRRPAMLPAAPSTSLHLERPNNGVAATDDDFPAESTHNCLSTRAAPEVRQRSLRTWTYEAVVNFLDTPHFGRTWQSIIGRNGLGFLDEERHLPLLVLKLAPDLRFWLQTWLARDTDAALLSTPPSPPLLITKVSEHVAVPDTWYHLVVVCDGETLKFYVNGQLEAASYFKGALPHAFDATKPLGDGTQMHGDLTFGCGMHRGVLADTCSCLLSEVRALDRALAPSEWLWIAARKKRSN